MYFMGEEMKKLFITTILISLYLLCSNVEAAVNYTYSTPKNYDYNKNTTIDSSQEKILFIVDFSNSMNEKMGHRTKLDVALSTMQQILQLIPQNVNVGLRVYGHKTGFTPRQSCSCTNSTK